MGRWQEMVVIAETLELLGEAELSAQVDLLIAISPPTTDAVINAFTVLGISFHANDADIKQAYRKEALKHHPDRNEGDPEAEKRFKRANEAYELLTGNFQIVTGFKEFFRKNPQKTADDFKKKNTHYDRQYQQYQGHQESDQRAREEYYRRYHQRQRATNVVNAIYSFYLVLIFIVIFASVLKTILDATRKHAPKTYTKLSGMLVRLKKLGWKPGNKKLTSAQKVEIKKTAKQFDKQEQSFLTKIFHQARKKNKSEIKLVAGNFDRGEQKFLVQAYAKTRRLRSL